MKTPASSSLLFIKQETISFLKFCKFKRKDSPHNSLCHPQCTSIHPEDFKILVQFLPLWEISIPFGSQLLKHFPSGDFVLYFHRGAMGLNEMSSLSWAVEFLVPAAAVGKAWEVWPCCRKSSLGAGFENCKTSACSSLLSLLHDYSSGWELSTSCFSHQAWCFLP